MRHRVKRHRLALPADQRKAMLRSLATNFFLNEGEITTTRERAKALRPYVEKIITTARKDDVAARRKVKTLIFDQSTGDVTERPDGQPLDETVLRYIFKKVAPRFQSRPGGYTRIIPAPPRRGDASPMAIFQLVD